MKSALAIQCLPLAARSNDETYRLVDGAIAAIDASGLSYTVSPFETVVEGPLDQLWQVAQRAHAAIAESGAPVATYMKLFTSANLGSTEEKIGKYRR